MSVVVTTLNNADTLAACLDSVSWADDLLVLDSGSVDTTISIAEERGARVATRAFSGYSEQKQAAIDQAQNEWVLLLDADEMLGGDARDTLETALIEPVVPGYVLWRREWLFWRWQSQRSRLNHYLRLFDRRRARMNGRRVHEVVEVDGQPRSLNVVIAHHGEPDIAGRVRKANRYSTLQVDDLQEKKPHGARWRMLVSPWAAFLRYYVVRGHWREGWAGFIAARLHAFYTFVKYAKLHERQRRR